MFVYISHRYFARGERTNRDMPRGEHGVAHQIKRNRMRDKIEEDTAFQTGDGCANQARICFVVPIIPPQYSGAGLRAYRYASRLHQKERLAFIVTERTVVHEDAPENLLQVLMDVPEQKIFRVPRRPFKRRYYARMAQQHRISFLFQSVVLFFSLLLVLLRRHREYDVIFCFTASQLPQYAALIGTFLHKKVVITSTQLGGDDPWALCHETHGVRRRFHSLVLARANAYISISRPVTEACEKAMMPSAKVWEIPNPVDTCVFAPCADDERASLRDDLGIDNDVFAVLFVGSIIARKGVDLAVEALGQLTDIFPRVELFLVGSSSSTAHGDVQFVSQLRRRISELGIDNRVRFIGVVGNVPVWMKACDAFVFPSRSEGFGTVLVEAMASGLPVVTGELRGIAHTVINHGEDGYIVDYTADAIASTIRRLCDDVETRRRISENAVKSARERFSIGVIDAQYDCVYASI